MNQPQPQRFIGPMPPPPSSLDVLFGKPWPDQRTPGRPGLVIGAALVGLLGAALLPDRNLGLGVLIILLAGLGVVGMPFWRSAHRGTRPIALLVVLLVSTMAIRDAGWAVGLCLVTAVGVGSALLSRATTVMGMIISGFAVPMAWLRGLPWLKRSLAPSSPSRHTWSVVRTVIISGVSLVIFGALFASADAVFARWASVLVPRVDVGDLPFRFVIFGLVAAAVLGGVYVALNPPQVERFALGAPRTVRHFEWTVPVGAVAGIFVVFLAAQLSALFGGHGYLQRTTGLTYATYVHQGFGQMVGATAIVLVVVAITARRAPRRTVGDRLLLRVLLGGLCFLTLVVIASALYRIHIYEEAYGFTRLRLAVTTFELWLGVVLLLVATAGVRLRGAWVPRVAVLVGAVMILGLTLASPDAMIAERNVDRFERTHQVDWSYLSTLSADAVPALDRLSEPYRSCALTQQELDRLTSLDSTSDWADWNLGRARATDILDERQVGDAKLCSGLPSR